MKKILSLALSLVLIACALCACAAKPNTDYQALKASLEEKGYGVGLTKKQENAEAFGSEFGVTLSAKGLDAMLMATKTNESYDIVDMVVVFYFESDAAAEKAFDQGNYEKLFQKMVKSYKSDNAVDLEYDIRGSMFWIGTAQGILDAQ
ncbi:MAG: hypothetical protein IJW29_03230 [Clostridia bacterium]|nr:hypothetical protein [Clostridia bacterium]